MFCALAAVKRHEQIGSSLTRIVQEPQSPALHPTLVPFKPKSSLKTLLILSEGLTFKTCFLPFRIKSNSIFVLLILTFKIKFINGIYYCILYKNLRYLESIKISPSNIIDWGKIFFIIKI